MNCPDCKDTGKIELLNSVVDCGCKAQPCPALARDRQIDPACFGTINGVTLHGGEDPVTYTLDIEEGTARGRRFTGLSKDAVDFVHAALQAGWGPDQVAAHLDEMATFRKVRDAAAVREAEAAALKGFTLDEIQDAARNIQAALLKAGPDITEDGEEEAIVAREIIRLLIRKTLREAFGDLRRMPGTPVDLFGGKRRFATGGPVNVARLSFVPETHLGTPPPGCEFVRHERKGHEPEVRVAPSEVVRLGGKAEMFKAMYGGIITDADFSQVEARVLAHFERKRSNDQTQ